MKGPILGTVLVLQCALAGQQWFEAGKLHLPGHVDDSWAGALGDVDGDGDLDLVVGNRGQDRLYLNSGAGVFADATAQLPADNDTTTSVALGDVDGDGDLDLVFGNSTDQDRLLLNDGTGTFTDATSAKMPPHNYEMTSGVALGDVDGDGDLDLVLSSTLTLMRTGTNRLYLNDGTGTFVHAPSQLRAGGYQTLSLALGDVDGDGDLDLLLGNSAFYPLVPPDDRLYVNDGAGTFTDVTAQQLPQDNEATGGITLADVDGDGDLDAVLANHGQSRLYHNDGSGTFTFTGLQPPFTPGGAADVAAGDVDGDGDLDLVIARIGQDELLVNQGAGVFHRATAQLPIVSDQTLDVLLGEVDGDGDLDLVAVNLDQASRLHVNDGSGTFWDATVRPMPTTLEHITSVAVGDLDGDGARDLVFGTWSNTESLLFLNDGRGSFADVTAQRFPGNQDATGAVAAGDVDGDGDLDVILGNLGPERLYLNDGAGFFSDASSRLPSGLPGTHALALGDVDGDGDLDLFVGKFPFGLTTYYSELKLNDGQGTFVDGSSQLPRVNRGTSTAVLVDVDGDADLDLVLDGLRLYLNDGTGHFADVSTARLGGFAGGRIAAGDVDGDGDADLVATSVWPQDKLYLNDGLGFFTDATTGRMPTGFHEEVALGDVDEDGDLDLVLSAPGGGQSSFYVNDGTGTFAVATSRMPVVEDRTVALALADMDRDEDLDLVVGNYEEQSRMFANLHRHLHTPHRAALGGSFQVDLYAQPGFAARAQAAALVLGTGLLPAPVPIPPFGGAFAVDPTVLVILRPLNLSAPGGALSLDFGLPAASSLVGATLAAQAFFIHGPTAAAFSNPLEDVLER